MHTKVFSSAKKEQEFFDRYNLDVDPVTDQLLYRYDYGDGWEVTITCTGEYAWLDRTKNRRQNYTLAKMSLYYGRFWYIKKR